MHGKDIPPKIGRDFFVIGHGIDNREVWIDLEEVVGVEIGSRVIDGADGTWSHYTTFILRSGLKMKDELTDKGMEELAEHFHIEGWTQNEDIDD